MPGYNQQWENQIKGFRKNRLLLVVRGLPFNVWPATVEAAIRARLTRPDSFIFLWPPGATNPNRHIGWVMLGFNRRPDAQMALEELQNFELLNRPVNVERASRQPHRPSSSRRMEAAHASDSTTSAATTATAIAAVPAPTTTIVLIPATPATTTTTTTTTITTITTTNGPSDSLERLP